MKKLLGLLGLLAFFSLPAMAQETPKLEVSGGYNYLLYYQTSSSKLSMNGWYASADYNLLRRLGAEAEVSGAYKDQGLNGKTDVYTFLFGPRIYPFRHHKVTPFAHFLFGMGHYNITFPAIGGFPSISHTDTALALEGGGGLDVSLTKHWGLRLVQADYLQTRFFGGHPNQGNYRVSVGFIYRFGEK